jgi:hypothetical protein
MPSIAAGKLIRSVLLMAYAGPALGAALSSTATKADFFDELFGFDQAPTPARTNQHSPRASARRQVGRIRSNVAYLPAYRQERSRKSLKKMSRLSQLLSDSTLRSGNIVVTEAGVRVFQGEGTLQGCSIL